MRRLALYGAMNLALLSLAACGGGGGGGSTSVPAGSAGSGTIPTANASLSVTVPNPTTSSATTRKPTFLTSSVQGMDVQSVLNGKTVGDTFFPLSALQSNCKAQGTGFVCTLQFLAPVGTSQLVVSTFDGTSKTSSNMLSTSSTTITVAQGSPNTFSVTTNGVVANLQGNSGSSFTCPILGTPSTTAQSLVAQDADSSTITGNLANPWTLSSSDTTGSFSVASLGPFSSATTPLNINYNGGTPTNGVAIFTATAPFDAKGGTNTILGSGAVMPIRATPAGPHMIYIADSANNNIVAADICQSQGTNFQPTIFNLPPGTVPTELRYDRFNWNANNAVKHLIVLGSGNNTLLVLDATTGSVLQTVTLSGKPMRMVSSGAESSGDSLFVTVSPNLLLKFALNASGPNFISRPGNTGSTSPLSLTVGNSPVGVNLEGFGRDGYVVVSGTGQVRSFDPSAFTLDATITLGGAPSGVTGESGDGLCTLVLNPANNTVSALQTNSSGASTITQIGSALPLPGTPQSFTFFPNSNVALVSTTGAGGILVTCSGGTSFAQTGTVPAIMAAPAAAANIPSDYVSPATGPGSKGLGANTTSIFVAGKDSGGNALVQAFNAAYGTALLKLNFFTSNAAPSGVVTGP